MPLFGHSRDPVETRPVAEPVSTPNRRKSLFGSHRSTSPVHNTTTTTKHSTHTTETASPHRGILHRSHEDASITNARERVLSAEMAEKEADRALLTARAAVREARDHVKRLEKEAAEE